MQWTYNRLEGDAREWAIKNNQPRGERCIKVNGGHQMGKSAIDDIAGNGLHGFSTRKGKQDEDKGMVRGMDGQWKAKRGSVAKRRKNTSRMATTEQINSMQMDSLERKEMAARVSEAINRRRKELRSKNRNHSARRGDRKV